LFVQLRIADSSQALGKERRLIRFKGLALAGVLI